MSVYCQSSSAVSSYICLLNECRNVYTQQLKAIETMPGGLGFGRLINQSND